MGHWSELNKAGFPYVWANPNGQNMFLGELYQRLLNHYTELEWWPKGHLETSDRINSTKAKLNMNNLPPHLRLPVARLRSSAHRLTFELGCYALPSPTPPGEPCVVIEGLLKIINYRSRPAEKSAACCCRNPVWPAGVARGATQNLTWKSIWRMIIADLQVQRDETMKLCEYDQVAA